MSDSKHTLEGFLKTFWNFDLNVLKKNKRVEIDYSMDSIQQAKHHLEKMLQDAKRDLAKAYKSHKSGNLDIEELFDYQWHVNDLEQQIKNLEDYSKDI
jgi:hypothetical protein